MVMKRIKQIKEDPHIQKRGLGFLLDSFWWMIFIALGWWLRGFVIDYYGTNLTFSEALVKVVQDTGGWKSFVVFLGSATAVVVKVQNIFKKRDGE